jgi:hypothetical protein
VRRDGFGVRWRRAGRRATSPEGDPVPYQRMAAAILANWRAVEWQILLMGQLDSPEAAALQARADWLRTEYEGLIKRAREDGRPQPPPFPAVEGTIAD